MTLQDSLSTVSLSVSSFVSLLDTFLPKLVMALFILGIGIALGYLFRNLLIEVSKIINLEKYLSTLPGYQKVQKTEKELTLTFLLAATVWWVVILVFLFPALSVLGYNQGTFVVKLFLNFLPNLISGTLILIIGSILAWFSRQVIFFLSLFTEIQGGGLIASFVSFVILIFSLNLAIVSFGLNGQIYQVVIIGTIAASALAAGLAGKEVFTDLVKKLKDHLK